MKFPSHQIITCVTAHIRRAARNDYEKYVIACIVLPLKATVFAYPTTVKVYWPWDASPDSASYFAAVVGESRHRRPPLPFITGQSDKILLSRCARNRATIPSRLWISRIWELKSARLTSQNRRTKTPQSLIETTLYSLICCTNLTIKQCLVGNYYNMLPITRCKITCEAATNSRVDSFIIYLC